MYVFTAIGIYLVAKSRAILAAPGGNRLFLQFALMGFGLWHVMDALFSHWILGIHRIRMDAESPLFWDLTWFFTFGLVPLLIGFLNKRKRGSGASKIVMSIVTLTFVAAYLTIFPLRQNDVTIALFPSIISSASAFAAIISVDGEIIWTDESEQVWVIRSDTKNISMRLLSKDAILVSGNGVLGGCFDWIKSS